MFTKLFKMVQLKKYTVLPEGESVVLILDKKSKIPSSLGAELKESVKTFLKSEDNF